MLRVRTHGSRHAAAVALYVFSGLAVVFGFVMMFSFRASKWEHMNEAATETLLWSLVVAAGLAVVGRWIQSKIRYAVLDDRRRVVRLADRTVVRFEDLVAVIVSVRELRSVGPSGIPYSSKGTDLTVVTRDAPREISTITSAGRAVAEERGVASLPLQPKALASLSVALAGHEGDGLFVVAETADEAYVRDAARWLQRVVDVPRIEFGYELEPAIYFEAGAG